MGPKEAAIDGAGGGRQDLDEYEPKSDGECRECGIWLPIVRQEKDNSYTMSAKFIFETLALARKLPHCFTAKYNPSASNGVDVKVGNHS